MYANPGISVAALHAENMKLAAFYLRLMMNVSRACDVGDITIVNIERARNYKIEIEAHTNVKLTDAPALKPQKVFEFFTELSEFAFDMMGEVSKIPLAYVIREHEDALPELTEPPFGAANSPFESINQELVARAPIFTTDAAGARILCHHYTSDKTQTLHIRHPKCNIISKYDVAILQPQRSSGPIGMHLTNTTTYIHFESCVIITRPTRYRHFI